MFLPGTQSGSEEGDVLRSFLRQVGLSWPQKSATNRGQLLDSLVTLSLDAGMPTLWSFVVGRHLSRPTENALYMSLDHRYHSWCLDVERLHSRGVLRRYLRRCAEVVGGLGGSYSSMIDDVMATHVDLWSIVQSFWSPYNAPRYVNLSDPELRRAVDGHLPDDSQLWADDSIVDLQPGIFDALDDTYLKVEKNQERFKLFLGAYLVWALSPFLSSHLDSAMLDEMGRQGSSLARKARDCLETVDHVMPLVSWKLQAQMLHDVHFAWGILHAVTYSLIDVLARYSDSLSAAAVALTGHLKINSLNMSSTWPMLDKIYDFVPVETINGSYFGRYRRAARAAALVYKQSLRAPRQNVYHMPTVSREPVYRLLVTREVPVTHAHLVPPLSQPGHPLAVPITVVGLPMACYILALLYFMLFYSDQFVVRR
ncbi:hypothetical protein V5799_032706 [Amblyomma americanum]|uniref:Uncharacterized protein n=1 Tax=Amblyomma americanum TaxID=6943 RepID=A0AAQ4DQE9_AMBAM